jgi:hypothetical protein
MTNNQNQTNWKSLIDQLLIRKRVISIGYPIDNKFQNLKLVNKYLREILLNNC